MDILSLSVRLNPKLMRPLPGPQLSAPAKASASPATATPAPVEVSPAIKRMLERSEEAKQAIESAKAQEKIVAKERRKVIKQRLDQIIEKLRILKNLYANNPKKMAEQLGEVFKELKTTLKDYRNAGGTLTQMIGDTNGMGQVDTEKEPLTHEESKEWLAAAQDAKAFIGNIGAIAKKVKELLEDSRLKAKMMAPDKDRDKAFDEADERLKELTEFMEDMGRDISEALENMHVVGEDPMFEHGMSQMVAQTVDVHA